MTVPLRSESAEETVNSKMEMKLNGYSVLLTAVLTWFGSKYAATGGD